MRQILALNQEQRSLARKGKESLKCISEIFRRKVKIKIQNLYFCNSSIYSVKSEKGDYFFCIYQEFRINAFKDISRIRKHGVLFISRMRNQCVYEYFQNSEAWRALYLETKQIE